MSFVTQQSLYTPMAKLLLVLVAFASTALFFTELYFDPFAGLMNKPHLLGGVALVSTVIAVASFYLKGEAQLKRWMLGLLVVPLIFFVLVVLNPQAPLVNAPGVVLVTLIAIASAWRIWFIYALLIVVAILHVVNNTIIDPYAFRFWLVAFTIALPLHTLLSGAGDYVGLRRRAAVQFLMIGFVLVGLLTISMLWNQNGEISPLASLFGLVVMAMALYVLQVKNAPMEGYWGRLFAILLVVLYAHGLWENGAIATTFLPAYVLFTFFVIKPREAFSVAIGLLIAAVTIQKNVTSGLFAIDGVFVRYAIINMVFIAVLYQLRQLQEGEVDNNYFAEKSALVPMGLFIIYGVFSAAVLFWVQGDDRVTAFSSNSQVLITNAFAWILMTWMATALTLEAQRMRKIVKAMEEAQSAYLKESRKVATLMKRQAVDSLLGGLAHNLNNMLQPVMMLSEHLMQKPAMDQSKRAKIYATIHQATKEQKMLLDKVFLHAREVEDDQLATGQTFDDIVHFAQAGLRSDQCLFLETQQPDDHRDKTFSITKSALHTTLLNVINNGLQAAKHKDQAIVTIMLESFANRMVIRVKDNGEGMSPEVQRRAMDKFFTTKSVSEGTGLGLSEVKDVLSQVNGDLEIESSSPEGTTIKITLLYKVN